MVDISIVDGGYTLTYNWGYHIVQFPCSEDLCLLSMDLGVLFRFHGMQNCNCLAQLQPREGGGGRHGTHRIIKATESCKSDTASDRSERIPFPFGFLFTDGNTVDAPQSIPSCSGKKSQDVSTADRLSSTNLWASWDARACGAWSSRSRSDRFQGSDDYHSPLKKMYISELKAKYQVRGPTLIRNFSGGMAKPASRSARSAAPRELWHALATDSESKEFGEKCLSWAVLSDSGLQAKHRIQCFPSFKSLIKLGSCRSSRLLSCWNSNKAAFFGLPFWILTWSVLQLKYSTLPDGLLWFTSVWNASRQFKRL